MVSFIYQSQDDLLTGQEALIDLAFHLLDYCEAPINQKPIYYECLTLIMDRGEFSLNYMGFDQARADLFLQKAERTAFKNESSKMLKSINKKLKVCLNYQNLLYRTLEKVLHKLNQKKLEDKEREFVESFCAIAYFRIPEFRGKLLESLIDANKGIEIDEWRGTEWRLDSEIRNSNRNRELLSLFDWEKDFYRLIKVNQKYFYLLNFGMI